MATSVFQSGVFQGGGVFQLLTPLDIDGVGYGAVILDRSPKITLNSLDLTLVDPVTVPALNDAVEWSHHLTWTGNVVAIEASTVRSPDATDHRYVRITAKNADVWTDLGDVGFGLSDDPDDVDTFGYKDLVIQQRYQDTVTETRGKVTCWKDGVAPGYEIEVTSPADDLAAEVFTILGYSVSFPLWDTPEYDLDIGLGDFTQATEGGAPDTPFEQYGDMGPDDFQGYIENVADAQINDRVQVYTVGNEAGFESLANVVCTIGYGQLALIWGDAGTVPMDVTQTTGTLNIVLSDDVPFAYVTGTGTFTVVSYLWAHIIVAPGDDPG